MADEQADQLTLPPLPPRAERAAKAAAAMPGPAATTAEGIVGALIKALGGAQAQEAPVRYPEDHTEIRMRSNRDNLHVDPAHLAYSQIAGTAYGQDGPSRKYNKNDEFVVRPGPWVDSLIEGGHARMAK